MENIPPDNPMLQVEHLFANAEVSVVRIVLNGLNWRVVNHRSTTTYAVVSGSGSIIVGMNTYPLQEGAAVAVPAGTPYQDQGENLVLIATSIPPHDPESVQYLGM